MNLDLIIVLALLGATIVWIERYGLADREERLRVWARSPLVGRPLDELDLPMAVGVRILAVERRGRLSRHGLRPAATTELQAHDILRIDRDLPGEERAAVYERFGLQTLPLTGAYFAARSQEVGMAEVMVATAGNDRFSDFIRIGLPFTLITLVVSVLLVPMVLPLY